MPHSGSIIYDFGANNGDDITYYLLRADRVVAVEANPLLCAIIETRFGDAIAAGRLVVENVVLDTQGRSSSVPFYIHKHNDVLSQFPKPENVADFRIEELPAIAPHALIMRHGAARYIKVDVEHYDEAILRDLFAHDIRPRYISAELHSAEVLATLSALGGYRHFKLVDGISVSDRYRDVMLETPAGAVRHAFPYHSAGPFGDDIAGAWMTTDQIIDLIVYERLGWKDLHATSEPSSVLDGEVAVLPYLRPIAKRALKQRFGR